MKIIVIMCDTLRYDHLGCYGNDWIRTPHLDRLAGKSFVFDRAYIGSFPTIPNRTDLFTGRFCFPFMGWSPLDRDEAVLSESLGSSGYVTQLIHDTMHMLDNGNFFARGFSGWQTIRGGEADRLQTLANIDIKLPNPDAHYRQDGVPAKQYLRNRHFWTSEEDWFIARTAKRSCEWLEQNYKAKDFLLWIDTFQIHEPWDPPQWYVDLYDPKFKGKVNIHPRYDYVDFLSKSELRQARARYAGEVSLVDTWIGRVLEKLEVLNIAEETMIVVTSDHGMYLGEHRRIGKHTILDVQDPWPLYDEVARIPLIIKMPGQGRKKRTSAMVQPPDLMPTILDLARKKIPADRHGKSFKRVLQGKTGVHRKAVYCSGQLGGPRVNAMTPVTVTRSDGWTLIFSHPENPPELYNLRKDPGQKTNVIRANKRIARELQKGFIAYLESIGTPDDHMERVRIDL